jgi:DNA-directed RNA polymerase subunit RPC12/RpoP
MQLSDKSIQEFKDIFEKEYGKKLSDAEARESAENLMGFMSILYDQAVIEARRTKRLEKEPEGFFLDATEGPYTCGICGENHCGNEIWWNLDGLRCTNCWRNIKEGVIPSLKHRYDNDGV